MSSTIDRSIATNSSSNRWTRILGKWPQCVCLLLLLACSPGDCFFLLCSDCGAQYEAVVGSSRRGCVQHCYMCVNYSAVFVPMLPGTCSLFQVVLCAVQETHECLKWYQSCPERAWRSPAQIQTPAPLIIDSRLPHINVNSRIHMFKVSRMRLIFLCSVSVAVVFQYV